LRNQQNTVIINIALKQQKTENVAMGCVLRAQNAYRYAFAAGA